MDEMIYWNKPWEELELPDEIDQSNGLKEDMAKWVDFAQNRSLYGKSGKLLEKEELLTVKKKCYWNYLEVEKILEEKRKEKTIKTLERYGFMSRKVILEAYDP